jgi:hypothetical protein
VRSKVIVPSSNKRQQAAVVLTQLKKMKTFGAGKMSIASEVTEVPSDLDPGGKTDYLETNTMYKEF